MTRGINTFTWSGAVKSLTLLLLRTATSKTEIGNQIFSLSGAKDSAASKLDFALGKKPAWLLDMFGVDSKGMALSNRLFSRNNPERKRPGPVSIFLNTNFFNLQCLQILDKNGNKLEEAKITEIADFIESDLTGKNSLNSNISKITKKTHEFVKEDSSVQLNSPEHSFFGMPDTLSINALRAILTSSSEKQIEGSKDLFRQSSPILKEMFRKEILKV